MDTHLRSSARARAKHKKSTTKAVVRSPREQAPGFTECLLKGPATIPEGPADLTIANCRLWDREGRFSVAVRDGVIQRISLWDEQQAGQNPHDAAGGLLMPGFTDAHVHLLVGAERLDGCDLESARDPDDLRSRLQAFARENPDRPVLQAYGLNYLDPPLIDPERARFWLDEIVSDRPLMILAHDLHTLWTNSKALEESDMLVAMPPFPRELEELGARETLQLDSNGVPTGELREPECYFLVEGALRSRYPQSPEQKLEALRRAAAELNKLGITSVHNMGLAMPEEDVEVLLLLLELEERGELTLRVDSSFSILPDEFMFEDVHEAADIRSSFAAYREGTMSLTDLHKFLLERLQATDDNRRYESQRSDGVRAHQHIVANHVHPHARRLEKRLEAIEGNPPHEMVSMEAVKLFLDGVIEKNTAYRSDRRPEEGIPTFAPEDLAETVALADRLGLQARAHCIGDAAVTMMLDAVEAARSQNADNDRLRGHRIRHRVEHIEVSRPDDLPRFAKLDVVPSMQPFHCRPPTTLWHTMVPPERWGTAFPWRTLSEQGTPPVFGSDWPIVSCDCLAAVRHASERVPWGTDLPNQGLSVEEAFESFTSRPPYAVHREDRLGRVEPGMLADLVVLSEDSLTSMETAEVRMTISAGRVVFHASDD